MSNNRILNLAIVVAVAAVVAVGTASYIGSRHATKNAAPDTFERVTSSGVLRCGYVVYPPGLINDPNTGKISGIFPDVLEQAAHNLGLKVDGSIRTWGPNPYGPPPSRRAPVNAAPVAEVESVAAPAPDKGFWA